jgi:hypothetical protein
MMEFVRFGYAAIDPGEVAAILPSYEYSKLEGTRVVLCSGEKIFLSRKPDEVEADITGARAAYYELGRLQEYERIVLTLADQRNCMDDPSKVVEIIEREYQESSAIADENIRLHALLDGVTCAVCGRAMVEHEQRCEEG